MSWSMIRRSTISRSGTPGSAFELRTAARQAPTSGGGVPCRLAQCPRRRQRCRGAGCVIRRSGAAVIRAAWRGLVSYERSGMAQAAKFQEPSMEEILASIRRIIAEDDSEKSAPRPAETAGVELNPDFAALSFGAARAMGDPYSPPPE